METLEDKELIILLLLRGRQKNASKECYHTGVGNRGLGPTVSPRTFPPC